MWECRLDDRVMPRCRGRLVVASYRQTRRKGWISQGGEIAILARVDISDVAYMSCDRPDEAGWGETRVEKGCDDAPTDRAEPSRCRGC